MFGQGGRYGSIASIGSSHVNSKSDSEVLSSFRLPNSVKSMSGDDSRPAPSEPTRSNEVPDMVRLGNHTYIEK